MHRTNEIALAAEGTDRLLAELEATRHLICKSVQRAASIRAVGNIVVVQAMNRGADAVMRAVAEAKAKAKAKAKGPDLGGHGRARQPLGPQVAVCYRPRRRREALGGT